MEPLIEESVWVKLQGYRTMSQACSIGKREMTHRQVPIDSCRGACARGMSQRYM